MVKIIRNKRGIVKILALAILLFGVTIGSAVVYTYTSGAAQSRAVFQRKAVEEINDIEAMEIFYQDMMEYATREALNSSGYDRDSFCPLAVTVDEDLEDMVRENGTQHIQGHGAYMDTYPLPALITSGDNATLEITPTYDYLEVKGIPAERMEVSEPGTGISIYSEGFFRVRVPRTVEKVPDLKIEEVKIGTSTQIGGVAGPSSGIGGGIGGFTGTVNSGDYVLVSVKVKNMGCDDVTNFTDIGIYDGDPLKGGIEISRIPVTGLAVGESMNGSVWWTADGFGPHWIYAVIDEDNKIVETHEGNNKLYSTVEVSCSGNCLKCENTRPTQVTMWSEGGWRCLESPDKGDILGAWIDSVTCDRFEMGVSNSGPKEALSCSGTTQRYNVTSTAKSKGYTWWKCISTECDLGDFLYMEMLSEMTCTNLRPGEVPIWAEGGWRCPENPDKSRIVEAIIDSLSCGSSFEVGTSNSAGAKSSLSCSVTDITSVARDNGYTWWKCVSADNCTFGNLTIKYA